MVLSHHQEAREYRYDDCRLLGIFDGTDAHRIGEDAMREQFEVWIKRGSSLACFDLGEGGNYIVLGMQDMFEAFCAGAILAGSNA